MRRPGHPSRRRLSEWLAGEDQELDRHLSTCEYCADRLESLIEISDAAIQEALQYVLTVPSELPERLQADVEERLDNRRDLLLITEFFGLPLRTARAMTGPDRGDE